MELDLCKYNLQDYDVTKPCRMIQGFSLAPTIGGNLEAYGGSALCCGGTPQNNRHERNKLAPNVIKLRMSKSL